VGLSNGAGEFLSEIRSIKNDYFEKSSTVLRMDDLESGENLFPDGYYFYDASAVF